MEGKVSLDNILLVDDDDITNLINCRIIRKFNIARSTVVAKSCEEALKYIRGNDAPSLILLDIHMPVLNGFKFLEKYSKRVKDWNKSKIIILSSSISLSDRCMAASYGIQFLKKPLSGEELLKIIKLK